MYTDSYAAQVCLELSKCKCAAENLPLPNPLKNDVLIDSSKTELMCRKICGKEVLF